MKPRAMPPDESTPVERGRAAQHDAGDERQINREKNILEHRNAEYDLGFGICHASVVKENFSDDGA